jgi:pseudomonalisin
MCPGILSCGEETETDLDVEWSGAVARNALIQFVVSKSTNSSDGDLSAQYIVNHNFAPVMSVSFGLCETALGSSGNSFMNAL